MNHFDYEIRFNGATYQNRCIELYLSKYKYSQWLLRSPMLNCSNIFAFTSDEFWRAHEDLNLEVKKILTQEGYKHLWFLMGWDLPMKYEWENRYRTFEWWKHAVDEWIEEFENFNPNEEEYQMCVNSFYNKYERLYKRAKRYNFIGNEVKKTEGEIKETT